MEKQKLRLMRVKRKHILARLLLSLAAVVILLPVVLTALYSFFPNEIKARSCRRAAVSTRRA
ncbi:MAG: hypothetical protein ACLVJB_04680 [Christensenellales bacterium]